MEKWSTQLSAILNSALKPMEFALFYNDNKSEEYELLYSTIEKYKDKSSWDVYSIPSLTRVLTLKNNILSEACLEKFYKTSTTEICFVLEWGSKGRKIIVFNIEQASFFDQELFIESINNEQANLKKLFSRIQHS